MKYFNFRFYQPKALITLIISFGLAIYFINQYISHHFGFTLSVIGVISGFLVLVDQYLWKYPPFKWLLWVPDISGRYQGLLEFSYNDTSGHLVTGKLECIMVVRQTASRLIINSFFLKEDGSQSTPSESINADIIKEQDHTFTTIFTYLNKGNEEFGPHYGTAVLKLIETEGKKALKGNYYTSRKPFQTRGRLALEYQNNQLHHEF